MTGDLHGTPDTESGEAGLTLVELLVVIGLMALIGVFISGGLRAIRAAVPLSRMMDASDETGLARDHLRKTISEAVSQSLLPQDLYFEGTTQQLGFVAAADPVFEAPGLVRVRLSVELVDGVPALVERRQLDQDGAPETGAAVLIAGIGSATFTYARGETILGEIRKGDPLPDRLVLTLIFPPGDRRQFRPLDVAIVCAPPASKN
ncbi:hypothetical protein SAMN05880582_104133 [Rhizobium sp. RU20A]|uniref:PulJ/GspJ family protein n=1 Tax=Rhizobium sp. RU20A TaxID=1907412 RepID=UPI000955A0B1|nr:hypothetical protein [Rhizobium sp. RU20A]SIQ86892.1 hypothetical protein SAMN05880582_104133 [Rhizobium sp. RU20A]